MNTSVIPSLVVRAREDFKQAREHPSAWRTTGPMGEPPVSSESSDAGTVPFDGSEPFPQFTLQPLHYGWVMMLTVAAPDLPRRNKAFLNGCPSQEDRGSRYPRSLSRHVFWEKQ
jgi:hypothetical protein